MTVDREALGGPSLDVAPTLLGAVLVSDLDGAEVAVRLTEVEAYNGPDDPASHAYRGRTPRNAVMFGPPGFLYCYFTYGMHTCANVVVGEDGGAAAVLLRAGEVVTGAEAARARRGSSSDRDLARGPARLCRALDLTLAHNGLDLSQGAPTLVLAPEPPLAGVASGPRVGLRGAAERPWRFWLPGEPTVSTYRPAAPLRTRTTGRERPGA